MVKISNQEKEELGFKDDKLLLCASNNSEGLKEELYLYLVANTLHLMHEYIYVEIDLVVRKIISTIPLVHIETKKEIQLVIKALKFKYFK